MNDLVARLRAIPKLTCGYAIEDVIDPLAHEAADEIERLLTIEGRLDLAIAMLPTFDGNGPGDCTDRLVAAVRQAAKLLVARRSMQTPGDVLDMS